MEIWESWKDHYRKLGFDADQMCKDGILDENAYYRSTRKVLFVLKETNNAPRLNLGNYLKDGPKTQMWHAIARWAVGILERFPEFNDITPDQMRIALSQVAVINLKKMTGGAAADISIVGAFALRSRELLRRQVRDVGAQIIIGCGTFEILAWLLELDIDPLKPFEKAVYSNQYGAWVAPFRHPNRANNRESYDSLKRLILGID